MKGSWLWPAVCLFAAFQGCGGAEWSPPGMGINYGGTTLSTVKWDPEKAVALMVKNNIRMVKIFGADPEILLALMGSDIEVVVSVLNEDLSTIGSEQTAADAWVKNNVMEYLFPGGVKIRWIAVGNEAFGTWQHDIYKPWLYPAMLHIVNAIMEQKLNDTVKVTTPVNTGDLGGSNPPSAGVFKEELVTLHQQILRLLHSTGSRFMVNVYPFLVAELTHSPALAEDAQFRTDLGTYDSNTGVFYTNLFDKIVDAVYAALNATGFPDMGLLIGEVGWPTNGSKYATPAAAEQFNTALIRQCLSGAGTPAHPNRTMGCFLFELLDEDLKEQGPGPFEISWGVFNATGSPWYPLNFTDNVGVRISGLSKRWCVAANETSQAVLQTAVSAVCGFNNTDCPEIAPGGACFNDSVNATIRLQQQASFAMNQQYQLSKQDPASCNGTIVLEDPSQGYCVFKIGTGNVTEVAVPTTSPVVTYQSAATKVTIALVVVFFFICPGLIGTWALLRKLAGFCGRRSDRMF